MERENKKPSELSSLTDDMTILSTILSTNLEVYIFIIALFFFYIQEPETTQHLSVVEWINKSRHSQSTHEILYSEEHTNDQQP